MTEMLQGTYAIFDGVELPLSRKGQGWELRTDEAIAGFTRNEYGQYVKRIAQGDPLELECFTLTYQGTYRGITFALQVPSDPVQAWTNNSQAQAAGFRQVDRGEWRKEIPLDDAELRITTHRTAIPTPWAAAVKDDGGRQAWDAFRDRLATTFRSTSDRDILVVASAADPRRYVQFARESDRLYAEAPGVEVVTDAGESVLKDNEWKAPVVEQPNWTSELALPALTAEYKALADRCVAALRQSYRINSPEDLCYRAWREAEQMPAGETWSAEKVERMDPGAGSLAVPGLGLKRMKPKGARS
ncbi:TY-Chap domain-containing protein [Paenarthrobacter nitroguajacolicus]|uniref:TY-Chap domain-containing protein n=1 Tax=Paenarthrobacter nitroguajacolicus TaxID=211146 RepID=UPI00285E3CBB|nr:hypothetical protein [Paenarthrobacter nitroguajacolicus]MDR6639031.1 hypothetical protein [Paenarthrobacter nitroguajacolicus]